jgi:hypothetical protein
MALDPRKRQKKLERKKAKDKKRALVERKNNDPVVRFEKAAQAPVLDSCVHAGIWNSGMGTLLFSRDLGNGGVAFATFLLDVYCLGVKNVFYGVTSRADYDWRIHASVAEATRLMKVSPEYARKLVEESAAYAQLLGFSPQADYAKARLIFGDIHAAACGERFEFGKNGKPLYIAGPHDNAAKRERILTTLRGRFGPEGYHFVIPLSGASRIGVGSDGDILHLSAVEE